MKVIKNKRGKYMKYIRKKEQGITLIVLVVTIIILIILAAITISFVLGKDGLLKQAENAKSSTEIAKEQERLELIAPEVSIKNSGDINVDKYVQELIDRGIIERDLIETTPDGSKEVVTDNGFVANISQNEDGKIEIIVNGKEINLPPKISNINVSSTSNSISIEVETKRSEDATYIYYYRENAVGEYKKLDENKNNTYIIENIFQDKKYDIKVEVKNENGTIEKEITVSTGKVPVGAITIDNIEWNSTSHKATVTITTSETAYKLQYAISKDGPWNEIESGAKTSEYELKTTIYARLFDGTNESKTYASMQITEKIPPEIKINKEGATTNSITVSVSASDKESGISANPTYSYYIKKSADSKYPSSASYTGTDINKSFTGLIQNTNYDIKVVTSDNANNLGEYIITIKTEKIPDSTISFNKSSWSNGKATVTLSTSYGSAKIQYQIGSKTGNWTSATENGAKIVTSAISSGQIVYARMWDGTNGSNIQEYSSQQAKKILLDSGPKYASGATTKNMTEFNGWLAFLSYDMREGNYVINDINVTGGGYIYIPNVDLSNVDYMYMFGGGFYNQDIYVKNKDTETNIITFKFTNPNATNVWYQGESKIVMPSGLGTKNLSICGKTTNSSSGILYLEKVYIYYK